MLIKFNTTKVMQAAAVLLKAHAGRMSRLRLLKLLYIADREHFAKTLRPITGDRAVALDNGPVPARTHNLLKGEDSDTPAWEQHISPEGPQDHRLIGDPGVSKLTRREIDLLHQVSEQHRQKNDYDIAIETQQFQEWIQNQPAPGGSKPISFDDLLAALGLAQHKQRLEDESQAAAALDRALAATAAGNAVQPAGQA
jgi:uncharacterized phage-associated protein